MYGKLAQIMGLIPPVAKKGFNDFHSYNYAKESDLVEAVRPLLSAYGIFFHWTVVKRRIGTVVRRGRQGAPDTTQDTLTQIQIRFKFIDGETGAETEPQTMWADGDDPADKGIYKAMTGAVKYALMKTFMIATGDDPEADKATDRRSAAREGRANVEVQRSERRPSPQGGRQRTASAPQTRMIGEYVRQLGVRGSSAAIALIEELTGDKVPPPAEGASTADSLAQYLEKLDSQKAGKLIHDLRAKVEAQPAQPATEAAAPAEEGADVATETSDQRPPEERAEDDALAAGAPY